MYAATEWIFLLKDWNWEFCSHSLDFEGNFFGECLECSLHSAGSVQSQFLQHHLWIQATWSCMLAGEIDLNCDWFEIFLTRRCLWTRPCNWCWVQRALCLNTPRATHRSTFRMPDSEYKNRIFFISSRSHRIVRSRVVSWRRRSQWRRAGNPVQTPSSHRHQGRTLGKYSQDERSLVLFFIFIMILFYFIYLFNFIFFCGLFSFWDSCSREWWTPAAPRRPVSHPLLPRPTRTAIWPTSPPTRNLSKRDQRNKLHLKVPDVTERILGNILSWILFVVVGFFCCSFS